MTPAKVVWIIGYPNAGKTAVAKELCDRMRRSGKPVLLLDGDEIRRIYSLESSDFDRAGRLRNARRIGLLAESIAAQGIPVVVAANTLYREAQEEHRLRIPGYFEVFLRASERLRRERDSAKDLYGRFDRGEIREVVGLDIPGDDPESPDLLLDMDAGTTPAQAAESIFAASGIGGGS